MKKFFIFLLMLLLIGMSACSIRSENDLKDSSPSTKESIQVDNANNKKLDDALKEAIISTFDDKGKTEILKVKKFGQAYLILILNQGEGGGIAIYYVEEGENNNFTAKGIVPGEAAMSMGFGVNRFILDDHTILFCNLNESTWIPENDTRKETKYTKIIFEFDNGNTLEENVENDKGYILISDSIVHIKDMKLYNANNEIVSTYKDIGSSTKEENYRLLNSDAH